MPQLGESVTEGTVTRWLKNIGDTVAMDEPLLEISTDKVDTEIPSPVAGVLLSITANEDDTVEVGAELAVIGAADEAGTPAPATPAPAPAAIVVPAPTEEVPAPAASAIVVTPPPAAPTASGSTVPIVLPALGESVTEGTVTRWLKNIGDAVALDEPLLEISTDKVDTELPSPVAGTLVSIAVGEDGTVQVGGVLGEISTGAAAPSASTPPPAPAPAAIPAPVVAPTPAPAPVVAAPAPVVTAPVVTAPVATPAPAAPQAGNGVTDTYVTPIVRKLASDNNIDLSTVTGTGVGGRIRKQDIEAAVASRPASAPVATPAATPAAAAVAVAPPAPAAHVAKHAAPASPLRGSTEKISRLRKVIAERMVESLQTTAQLTSVVEVDVTRVAALRDRAKNDFFAREGVKLTFLPFFARAALEALKQFPVVNATMDQEAGTITYYDGEHLGIAVDTERGLLVPVIHSAGDLNLPALAKQITDIAGRTRDNKVSPDELSGGTFTLTNTGSRGALFDTPILNLPQSAILGTGTVVKRPMVITDEYGSESIAIRSMVYLSLTYDHRLVDGADAARFLVAIKTRLEAGDFESELGL
jgi:2-oxoglutarate dehydrogenase E2 component (dihydrolipoamide succinyltransferase)